jgi:TetR/AcrR family transcriptional regulator, cholesterol catabolism regulator
MSKKRGPYASPRQQDRKLRILRTAASQLEKHGLASLTMQSIAETSDVSTKTLYNLFGSRNSLLLEAASEGLVDLEQSDFVLNAEPGIPRLLAFTIGSMRQFKLMPDYARAVITILIREEFDSENAYVRMGVVQRFAQAALSTAAEQGELRAGLDLHKAAYHIAANQWGAVLLWQKRLLTLDQLEAHVELSHHLTLAPMCMGTRKQLLEAKLEELLTAMAAQ